jgi:hypothetical protein
MVKDSLARLRSSKEAAFASAACLEEGSDSKARL